MRRDPMQNSAKVLVAFDIHTENVIISGYGSDESRENLFRIRDYLMDG